MPPASPSAKWSPVRRTTSGVSASACRVIERPGRAHVEIDHDRLLLYVPEGADREARTRLLERWYRAARQAIPPLISHWEPQIGRTVTHWGIRRMKTKWGSCNPEAARIWLNLELAKKHPQCLEYVVVHELAHFLERTTASVSPS